ncbi:MAG: glycosyl transferase [Proteobacteria bacterium]|nr:MAG: glycosyl transferase [Pseudomonadota bacterium]
MAVTETPTLVVLRALGLGDFLTAIPAYRGLAAAFPDHRRLLAAPVSLAPLLPFVGAFHGLVATHPLGAVPHAVGEPDVAVNLHGRGPESHRTLLACKPRRLLAFAHADVPESCDGPEWRRDEHEITRWCRMLEAYGVDCDPGDLALAGVLPPHRLHPGYTLIHPGAASCARRWPAERWAAVARAELDAGRRIVVTGGPSERELAERVARGASLGPGCVYAGDLDLAMLARLVGGAGLVLCTDTGVAHLATALERPSVLLFGPTSPALWGPPADRPWHRVLWSGRCGDPHADSVDPGLLEICVDDVVREIASLGAAPMASYAPAAPL